MESETLGNEEEDEAKHTTRDLNHDASHSRFDKVCGQRYASLEMLSVCCKSAQADRSLRRALL